MKQRIFRILTLILAALFLLVSAFAQDMNNLRFERITEQDGLSQNTVRTIIQDRYGFMWFGTLDGLNRYNGKGFSVICKGPEAPRVLSDNRIRTLYEDSDGYLWIKTQGGTIGCYSPSVDALIDYYPENVRKDYYGQYETSDGTLILYGRSGCLGIIHKDDGLTVFHLDEKLESARVYSVMEDNRHRLWFVTNRGIWYLDAGFSEQDVPAVCLTEDNFSRFAFQTGGLNVFPGNDGILVYDRNTGLRKVTFPGGQSLNVVQSLLLPDGNVMITYRDGLLVYDARRESFVSAAPYFKDGKEVRNASFITDNRGDSYLYNGSGNLWIWMPQGYFQPMSVIPPKILSTVDSERYNVWRDSRNCLWITTYGNGLFIISPDGQKVNHLKVSNSQIPSDYLLCLTEDRGGEIWIGTEFSGICKISVNDYPLEVFLVDPERPGNANGVKSIFEDSRGRWWFGTQSSELFVYDSQMKKCLKHVVTDRRIFRIREDAAGRIWMGTKGSGFYVFDGKTMEQLAHYPLENLDPGIGAQNVYDFVFDGQQRLWVGTFGGGILWADISSRNLNHLTFESLTVEMNSRIRAMALDRQGLIWAGSDDGVACFCPDSILENPQSLCIFRHDAENSRSIGALGIKTIFEDSRGRLWFGTMGGGLNLLQRETDISQSAFVHYTARNGLTNGVVQSIEEDGQGNIWVGLENGSISKLVFPEGRFDSFNLMADDNCLLLETSSYRTADGRLLFGGSHGMLVFDLSKVKNDTHVSDLVITGLKINGSEVRPETDVSLLKKNIFLTDRISLRYSQNTLMLEFALLDYQSPNLNMYMYQLEGYEKDWNQATRHNEVTYRNLPPGDYTFRVKACNCNGVWTSSDTSLKILVAPPFWRSWQAVFLYLLVAGLALFWISRMLYHIQRLNTAVEVERQLTEYKLRFFTNISHEFRTPLTIIQGALDSLSDIDSLPGQAVSLVKQINQNSARLLRLVDQLLDFRKLQNKGLDLRVERTEVVGFLRDVFDNFREMARRKHVMLSFESDCDEQEMYLDRSKFDKILYNLLSNAMKFTPENGQIAVHLHFSSADDIFRLTVSDSGPGVPKEKRGQLFVRFAQLGDLPSGTGVGLHLTAEMATVHKGRIEYAESPYGGASFVVTVPLADSNYQTDLIRKSHVQEIAEKEEAVSLDEYEGLYSDYRVLVVEDEEEVRDFVAAQLQKYFQIQVARDGNEGLQLALDAQPDLIVCDVMMPGLNGFEVTRRLKDNFSTSHIPVVLLTAYNSDEHHLEGVTSGADAYITKPFSTKFLAARIIGLIKQREALRQRFAQAPGTTETVVTSTDRDKDFMAKIDALIEKNMDNPDFSVYDMFTQTSQMGRTSFYKKLKGISGYTPNDYLRTVRLKRAAELLSTTDFNISEIAYKIGMNDPLYFSKSFKSQFGKSPSEYRKSL